MTIEEFFDNKENVENFLKVKTEKEARELLESKCGEVSDKEFAECQASVFKAVDDSELAEAAGGIDFNKIGSALKSKTAQKVYMGTIACGLATATFGSVKPSAYVHHGMVHLYNADEVEEIEVEARQEIEKSRDLIKKLKDKNNIDEFDAEIDDIQQQSELDFTFQRSYYSNYAKIIDRLKKMQTRVESRIKNEKLLDMQNKEEIKKQEQARRKRQAQEFKARKSGLIKDYKNLTRQIDLALDAVEDKSVFNSTIEFLNGQIKKEIDKLNEMNFKTDYYAEDDEDFRSNMNTLFEDSDNNLAVLSKKVNDLSKDVQKVKKDYENQLIELTRDEMNTKVSEYERKIIDEFSAQGVEKSVADSITKMGQDLSNTNDKLSNTIALMKTLDDKIALETEFRLFEGKYNRLLERKKKLVEDYLREQRKEINLENLHNFDAQLELLRLGELELKDVVGGYDGVIEKVNSVIDAHIQRFNTGKGIPSKGMVLYGKPGTGKTSLVRAIAAARGMNLVTLKKGSAGEDMSSEIKNKFDEAKSLTEGGQVPVIMLIDEIDAIGAIRIPGKTDKDTVSLLAEIDKLKPSDNVIILATTNLLTSVDAAVTRSGRLEESCEVSRPREEEIIDILKISLKGYKIEDGIELEDFISGFVSSLRGCSGADIKRAVDKTVQSKIKLMKDPRLSDITITRRDLEAAIKSANISQAQ